MKYLVLSDLGENRRYTMFKRAKKDHDKRWLNGEDGVEIWREHKDYDHLIMRDRLNVTHKRIKSVYKFFKAAI